MGILSDLTPAVFKLESHQIKARVLTLTEVMTIIKDELSRVDDAPQGLELDKLATKCINEFEFSDDMATRLIHESVKEHTPGFDLGDAQLLVTPVHGRQVGYQVFKYAVYGAFDEPDEPGDEEKKQEPGKTPA